MLFIWNIDEQVNFPVLTALSGTSARFPVTAAVLDISDILKFIDYEKSRS